MIEALATLLFLVTLPVTAELLLTTSGVLFFKAKPLPSLKHPTPKTAILIPAHNEASVIRQTL